MAPVLRRIGIFGGSFNPPHVAHALVGLYVLETAPIDELWFVPTYRHPFAKDMVSYDDRVAMCELVAAPLGPRARVSRAEEDAARTHQRESRTWFLLEHLAQTHPDAQFHLVIGADILHETAQWHRWDEIVTRAPPIVVGRGGVEPPPGAHVSELAMPQVSSTEVRRRLAAGEDAAGLVSGAVLGYIARRGLYR
jgi:nicotinate-nucleotide adenylyltransferase